MFHTNEAKGFLDYLGDFLGLELHIQGNFGFIHIWFIFSSSQV